MLMHVIGVTDDGRLHNSEFTTQIFDAIGSARIAAILAEGPEDVRALRSRVGCDFTRFLLVNDEGLQELQKRDADVKPLGQFNSAEILRKTILSPNVE